MAAPPATDVSWVPAFVNTSVATFVGVAAATAVTAWIGYLRRRPRLTLADRFILRGLFEDPGEGRVHIARISVPEPTVTVRQPNGWREPANDALIASVQRLRALGLLAYESTEYMGDDILLLTAEGYAIASKLKPRAFELDSCRGVQGETSSP